MTGNLALDYVATVAERGTSDLEHLGRPQDLVDWIAASGLVDRPPRVSAAGLERAKTVREALFAIIAAAIDGREPRRGALRTVNAAAAAPPPTARLAAEGLHLEGDLDAVNLSDLPRGAGAARRSRSRPRPLVRRRALHPPVRRPIARRAAAVVRDGGLRRPREGRRRPRPPPRLGRLSPASERGAVLVELDDLHGAAARREAQSAQDALVDVLLDELGRASASA